MRSSIKTVVRSSLWVAALSTLSLACAGDKGEVDRVQPGYVAKSELLGSSWYYRRTVVDNTENSGYVTIGSGDWLLMERVRWDVQEKFLFAYRDYEYITGAEGGTRPGADYVGTPVAAFPITSHFDIQREYNSWTGQQTNVLSENEKDRVWYERTYMRVDWSTNHASPEVDYLLPVDLIDTDGGPGGHFYVHEDDAANPWRARINPKGGYMDFVVNHWLLPDFYMCYYVLDFMFADCGPGEVKVRHAFMKVDEVQEAGYEPLNYPDSVVLKDADGNEIRDPSTNEVLREPIWERFGYYRVERSAYHRERGITESGMDMKAIRFNIWQTSKDQDGNSIPYAERTVRPIEYYLNYDFPADLKSTAVHVAAEWNDAFRATVASLQNRAVSEVPDVFILRENNCNLPGLENYLGSNGLRDQVRGSVSGALSEETLKNWCAATEYFSRALDKPFVWQQIGDPRFNMLHYVTEITDAGWLGLGPMFGDPISGRNVVATSYLLGHGIEGQATALVDYIDLVNGEVSVDDILLGSNLPYNSGLATQSATGGTQALQNNSAVLNNNAVWSMANKTPSAEFIESIKQRVNRFRNDPTGALGGGALTPLENSNYYVDRLARVAGTSFESEWLTEPHDYIIASKGAWKPGMPVDDQLALEASKLNQRALHTHRHEKGERFLHERTLYPAADLDSTLSGLAEQVRHLGRCASAGEPDHDPECVELNNAERRKLRRDFVKKAIFRSVTLHEIGHNVGLRHNFEGSWDAVNFHDQFWDLEVAGLTQEGKEAARQPEYMYSSIMDYGGRVNSDFQGLGKYDWAAIKFGYGQLVEAFVDDVDGRDVRDFRFYNDYKSLVAGADPYFSSTTQLRQRQDVLFDWNRTDRSAEEVLALLKNEVPYMFCSDEYANRTPTCRLWDIGANHREQTANDIVRYKNYFVFHRFLRNRLTLDMGRALTPAITAFSNGTQTYKYWYLYQSLDENFTDTPVGQDMLQASVDGLNLITEVLAMPEPGEYIYCGGTYYENIGQYNGDIYSPIRLRGVHEEPCEASRTVKIPFGQGLPFFFGFTADDVAWGFSFLGTLFDKDYAMMFLADPSAFFFRINASEDFRAFSVSPYRVFDREMRRIYDAIVRMDMRTLGSAVDEANLDAFGQPAAGLASRQLVDSGLAIGPDEPVLPPNNVRIYPAMSRNLQRSAGLWGMAFLTSKLDGSLDFGKHARVTLKGSWDDFESYDGLPADDKIECVIPVNGMTYRATKVNGESGIGYRMVGQCAQALEDMTAAELAVQQSAPGNDRVAAQNTLARANNRLLDAQQQLQYMRLLHLIFEHGAEL